MEGLKRIVFISDVLYYYLQWGKNSLTTCYRSNMFDNQIALIARNTKIFADAATCMEEENITYFYQYAVGHVIRCLTMLFDSRNAGGDAQVKAELFRILNNDSVIAWIQNVTWIPEDYEWLKQCVKNIDIGLAYERLMDIKNQKNITEISAQNSKQVY